MKRRDLMPHGTFFRYVDSPYEVFITAITPLDSFLHASGKRIHTSTEQSAVDCRDSEVELLDADTLLPLPDQADTLKPAEATLRPSGPLDNGLERVGEISPNLWNRSSTIASSDSTNPEHYNALSIEPIDAIESWGLGYNLGNVISYIARAGRKPAGGLGMGHTAGIREAAGRRADIPAGISGDLATLESGRRADLRKALRYLVREITGLDGHPSWDPADVRWPG